MTIEQRAHDLAVELTVLFQKIQIENQKNLASGKTEIIVNFTTEDIADTYCNIYDGLCKAIATKMSSK